MMPDSIEALPRLSGEQVPAQDSHRGWRPPDPARGPFWQPGRLFEPIAGYHERASRTGGRYPTPDRGVIT